MLFEQRLTKTELSPNEKIVANYILLHKEHLSSLTTRQIAKETFTTASTVIRLSQKMGYKGFNELKQDYLNELQYLHDHFQDIDPNLPFDDKISMMNIAGISVALMKETADDTLALLEHDSLMMATQLLKSANHIYVCGIENNLPLIDLFKFKMTRINRHIINESQYGNQVYTALQATKKDCAILVSYSGQTQNIIKLAHHFKNLQVPIIAITSIGDNTLKQLATCILHISTREKLHSKIANFSSEYSIMLLFNILYSTIFAQDYDQNLKTKIERTKLLETTRFSTTDIIKEE